MPLSAKNRSGGSGGLSHLADGIRHRGHDHRARPLLEPALVVAKSASFPFKGQKLPPAEIGRRLDVRYLLDGSVRRAGDRVRVTAELTEIGRAHV